MAAERNPYYGTNGAAAYDVYSANTVRQPVREPERRELPQEAPQKRQRVRARTAIAPFTILGAAITACMMILVIFGYVQLFEASSRVSRLESRLQSLQEDLNQKFLIHLLQSKYEGKIDLAAIEQRASELGLRKPSQEQIVYVNLTGTDQAEIYTTEKSSILGEMIGAIEQSISDLIAYLHPAAA